jgi:GNAT superfamily N-acetyltransferase
VHLARQFLVQLVTSLRAFREEGLRARFLALGQTILRIFYQKGEYVIPASVLSDQVTQLDSRPDLVIRQISDREKTAELSRIADPTDMVRLYEMFDYRSVVLGAFQNDQIIGYCWFSHKVDQSLHRVQPPLQLGDACVHDLFVSPEHRNQQIGRALISHRLHFLHERGYRRAVVAVAKGNAPAFKINKMTGHTQIGEMSHTRILFWDSFHHNLLDR